MTPRILHPLLSLLASVTRQELARQVAYLKEENRVLRERLPKRIVTTATERRRLLKAGRKLGTQLKELMTIASYDSFRRWVREVEERREKKAEESTEPKRKPGRPRTSDEIRDLIVRIKTETDYGYTKVRQELRKLGVHVSRQTVKNVLVAADHSPEPASGSDSWDAFLARHAATLWQCDFFTKPLWTAKGLIDIYLLVFLHLGTRRIWIAPATAHPDGRWVTQQARNFLMHAEDTGLWPGYVLHDRDTKFTRGFDAILKSAGATVKKTSIQSPNLQAHVERVIQTLQHEVLNHFVVVSERHLNHICSEAARWYNSERGHSARENLPPAWDSPPEPVDTIRLSDVACSTRLGGLLKHYWRRAA
ncbi:integrase core domain-containing protein [Maioricimonas sp. JC845]|uniref:integrase core domain-containing protein n=1 Tax=Maioricimonas sp. JC845 TaxID=3232138 RepID=UPI003457C64D